jgi:hypothetical protein
VTYDDSEDKDYSGELAEVDFFNSSEENDLESGSGNPVELALAQGDDGYMYAIDPKTRKVISRIEM